MPRLARRYEAFWRDAYRFQDRHDELMDIFMDLWDQKDRLSEDHRDKWWVFHERQNEVLEEARICASLASEYDRRARRSLRLAIDYGLVVPWTRPWPHPAVPR